MSDAVDELKSRLAQTEACWGANVRLMATQLEQLRKCRALLIQVEAMLTAHANQGPLCEYRRGMTRLSDDVTAMLEALPNIEEEPA